MTPDGGVLSHTITTAIEENVGRVLVGHGQAVRVDSWGICIKETAWGCVYLKRLIYNWRVALVEDPEAGSTGGIAWCYEGGDISAALRGASVWDGSPSTEPFGWQRAVHDDRYHSDPKPGVVQV